MNDVADTRASVETERQATTRTGPLGSTIYVLQADPQTVVALAAIDWNRSFRRVCLDPVRGLITLMAPSRLHEEFAAILGHVVDVAASVLAGAAKDLLNARLREPGSPPGTGMEPDCAFYLSGKARAYRTALALGKEAADAFFDENAPDLVVEVEITRADESKIERLRGPGGCGSSGCCRIQRVPALRGRSSSPCVPGRRPVDSPRRPSSGT